MEHLGNSPIAMTADFVYDGRGYLTKAKGTTAAAAGTGIFCDGFESGSIGAWGSGPGSPCFESPITVSTFGSEGSLYSTERGNRLNYVLYFGNRPVALVESPRVQIFEDEESPIEGTESVLGTRYRFLTTDPLGTPILATDAAGTTLWTGSFEPFGADWNGAQAAGIFLRLPGQWTDLVWSALTGANALYQNVNRWYEPGTGTYASADPAKMAWGAAPFPLSYAEGRPSVFKDPAGLWILDRSCSDGCKGGPQCRGFEMTKGAIDEGANWACKKVTEPGPCRQAIENVTLEATRANDKNLRQDALSCLKETNCNSGSKPSLKCEPCFGQCGLTDLSGTTLGGGGFNSSCPAGNGLGYGPTLLHESLHWCGFGGEPDKTGATSMVRASRWRYIEYACSGWSHPSINLPNR